MKNLTKKQQGIIIGFALVLLVSVVGITYAYFTAANNINTTNNVSVSTIELSDITINVLAPQGNTTNIYPGWVGYQVVTVEGDNGTGIGKYSLTIQSSDYATELGSDVTYTIYRSNSSALSPLPVANSFTGEYASGTLQTESVGNEFRYSIANASFTVPNSYTLVSENNLLSSAKNSAITFVNNT